MTANRLNLSTVSGDIKVGFARCDTANLSTVSGDIEISGEFKEKHCSAISGDISVTEYNKGVYTND